MDWKRRSESDSHRTGRSGRLGLVVVLLALTGCVTERDLFGPDNKMPGQGGSGISASDLVGEWEVTLLVTAGGDIQTWTTNWRFRDDHTCTWNQVVESSLEGTVRERERDCTWTEANSVVTVTYEDTGASEAMQFSFPAFDTGRLVLQGVEYQRIS